MQITIEMYIHVSIAQSADRTVSSFVDSSAQHRGNEAEPDSNGNKNFQSGPNVPCQSAQTDKSVSSALRKQQRHYPTQECSTATRAGAKYSICGQNCFVLCGLVSAAQRK